MTAPTFPSLETARAGDRSRVIVFEDLDLAFRIGVYDREKTAPQRMRVSIQLLVAPRDPEHADRIDRVVDYAQVHDGVVGLSRGAHVELQETLADRIAALCFEAGDEVAAVEVYVRKLDAYADCRSVGIRIVRRRDG